MPKEIGRPPKLLLPRRRVTCANYICVLVGVMGIQPVKDVTLIRHAYIATAHWAKKGLGGILLGHLLQERSRCSLVSWSASHC